MKWGTCLVLAICTSTGAGVQLTGSPPLHRDAELLLWVSSHGGAGMDQLFVDEFAHGDIKIRGLGTKSELANDSEVMRIPEKLLIRSSAAKAAVGTELAESLEAAMSGSSVEYGSGALAVFLASERLRGPDSFWAPYLASLPSLTLYKEFHSFFGSEELFTHFSELPLVATIREEWKLLEDAWSAWQQHKDLAPAQIRKDISWDNFSESYLWQVSHAAKGNMVPVFDLMNSAMGHGTAVSVGCIKRVDLVGYFEVRVNAPVGAGQELLNHYSSNYNNEMWLFRWAFVDSENPNPVPQLDAQTCGRLLEASQSLPSNLDSGDLARAQGFRTLIAEHCPA